MFTNGCEFWGELVFIPFTKGAKKLYNQTSSKLTRQSNILIQSIKDGDESAMMVGYMGKLYAYFGRFVMICAIIKNLRDPIITEECIKDAEKIYNYFKSEARKLLAKISNEQLTNLNENEQKLLNMLPEKFSFPDAEEICKKLGLNKKFFGVSFLRKYKFGYVKQMPDRSYLKML